LYEQSESNDETRLIPSISQLALPKLAKIIHYLRVMTTVKKYDSQVNQLSVTLKDANSDDQHRLKV